jgi:hypothetical protein
MKTSELVTSLKMDVGYLVACERQDIFDAWVEALVNHVDYFLRRWECKEQDHQWVDESNVGPESGDIALRCSHCGEHFRTILY